MKDDEIFEWDEAKRQQTLNDRDVDFADMVNFDFDTALTAQDDRHHSERRFMSIGYIENRLHVCVWCYREGNTRIISLRKANSRERKRYEQVND